MNSTPALRRWLAAAGTATMFALIVAVLAWQSTPPAEAQNKSADAKDQTKANSGKEWPMFGGTLSRNLVNTVDKNIPTDWNNDPDEPKNRKNIKWTVDLGSKAYGGPIISGGKIFIGTNNGNPRNKERDMKDDRAIDKGVLMCFDQDTGKFLWQAVFDKLPAGRVNDWPEEGICSSPVVEGDRLYFVCNRGELICASTNGYESGKTQPTMLGPGYTGKTDAGVIWRLDMIRKLGVFPHNLSTCSPLIVGDTIFLITSNGVDEGHINIPNPEAPSFIAVNKKTGAVVWQNNFPTARLVEARKGGGDAVDIKKLVDSGLVMMHGQWSNPVYAEPNGKPQVIFPGGDGWLYALDPKSGELIWKFDCNPKDSFYELGGNGTRSDFVCTPVVWENKLYIGVGQDPEHKKGVGHLWCIDITKQPKNKDKDLSPATKPAAKQGEPPQTLFDPKDPANKDSGLVWHYGGFLNPPPAKGRKWSFGRTLSTVCVHDGLLYTSELDGIVHCFDPKTGQHFWEHDMNADTWASPYWVDGHVYLGNDKGKMLIFKHGKEKKLVNTIDMNCGYIRNTPVVVNGVMYFITENPTQLWAIAAK
jgi:outer membrane protein assembly factor BamB